MSVKSFDCKQEEYLPISELAWKFIIPEKERFMAFSPVYNEAFFTDIDKEIKDVKLLIHPQVLESESKELTQKVYKMMENLRPGINAMESYVKKAEGQLTANPADFGFKELREEISAHNKEGVVQKARTLLQLVDRNLPAIQAKGFTAQAKTKLETEISNLESESLTKGQLIQDTAKNCKLYKKELNNLMNAIMSVCKDGKIIFAEIDPDKVKYFTFTQLRKLVRQNNSQVNGGTTVA